MYVVNSKKFLAYYLSFLFVFAFVNPNLLSIPIPYFNSFEVLIIPVLPLFLPFVLHKRLTRREMQLYFSILCVILSSFISILFAEYWRNDQFISIFRYVEYAAVAYATSAILDEEATLKCFIKGTVYFVITETFLGAIRFIVSSGHMRGYFLTNGIYLQQVFVALVALGAILSSKDKRTARNWFIMLIFLCCGILIAEIRIGYAVMVFSIGLFPFLFGGGLNRKLLRTLLTCLVLFLSVLVLLYRTGYLDVVLIRLQQLVEGTGTAQIRFLLWKLAWALFISHPVSGIGTGGFSRYKEYYAPSFSVVLEEEYMGLSTHHTILDILAETGLIGFMAYILYCLCLMRIVRYLSKVSRIVHSNWNRIVAVAVQISLISTLFMDTFAEGSFTQVGAVLTGVALGMSTMLVENYEADRAYEMAVSK